MNVLFVRVCGVGVGIGRAFAGSNSVAPTQRPQAPQTSQFPLTYSCRITRLARPTLVPLAHRCALVHGSCRVRPVGLLLSMAFPPPRSILHVLAMIAVAGCAAIPPAGKSPLAPARMSADSVALDIFFVRFPYGNEDINDRLWDQVDEQHFPAGLRRQLAQNGFRIGLVGEAVPVKLCQLLELNGAPSAVKGHETVVTNLAEDPRVVRRHLQLRANQRSEIIASSVYEELPVLTCESGEVSGRSYPKAQGLLVIKSYPQPDGRVRLEVTPELHYGEFRQRYVGSHGVVRLETARSRRTFDNLGVSATLAPGNMILMSSLPNRQGSLGYYFFAHQAPERLEQKLLIIRLSQTQHDGLFSPEELIPPDLQVRQERPEPNETARTAPARRTR